MTHLRSILTVPSLAVALLASFSSAAGGQESGEEVAEQLVKAKQLRAQGHYSAALEEARELLRAGSPQSTSDQARILICSLRRSLPGGAPLPRKASIETQSESGTAAEEAGPRHFGGDVRKPEKIHSPAPQYNESARKKKIQGVVIVQAIIDREGCVINTKVLKGLDEGLSGQAERAIQSWVFRPAELLGEPVDVYYNLTVNFRLQRKKRS